jgi:DNA-binding transcriptional ArsR family regulator
MLSPMNADLIAHEAQNLLLEVVHYEAPRLTLDEMPSLAGLAKLSASTDAREASRLRSIARINYDAALEGTEPDPSDKGQSKGHVKDSGSRNETTGQGRAANGARRESILAVLRSKGPSYIKDISMIVRDVSEKTIQRELSALVAEGSVKRQGDRRWTTYEIA